MKKQKSVSKVRDLKIQTRVKGKRTDIPLISTMK